MTTIATAAPSSVVSSDRLSFTLFVAIVLHGLLLFGLGFDFSQYAPAKPSISVTLSSAESDLAPDSADFVAQANQIGSGTLDEVRQITTDQQSVFQSETINTTKPVQTQKFQQKAIEEVRVITSQDSRDQSLGSELIEPKQAPRENSRDSHAEDAFHKEIASLSAKLAQQRQQYAKRPRERVLTTVSAKASSDAAYLNEWTQKIENIGSQNFPKEAVQNNIEGSLRLEAVIKWDGSLLKASIRESSGYRVLDNAALTIVRAAAPFAEFPAEIQKTADHLVIIRTWHFDVEGVVTAR